MYLKDNTPQNKTGTKLQSLKNIKEKLILKSATEEPLGQSRLMSHCCCKSDKSHAGPTWLAWMKERLTTFENSAGGQFSA